METTLDDIHPDIIQNHILPRLDGQSLPAAATVSSHLQTLCSDHNLWADVSKSTWPSITHPRVDDVISTFPAGHRSFFQDSFPSLITDVNHHRNRHLSLSTNPKLPEFCCFDNSSELISAVDIRYRNDVIYSGVEFTDTTTSGFMTSSLRIELNNDQTGNGLKIDEAAGADEATLSHLKESLTLNWILIDPTRKRAGNLSSIKPVSARQDWMTNETVVQYVTVLPDPNHEMVQCRIKVVLEMGMHVKKVVLKLKDLDYNCLNGRDFLVITQGAISEENNVRRKVVDDKGMRKGYKEFKEMKREKKKWVEKQEEKREFAIKMNYVGMLVSFCFSIYFLMLLLR